MSENAIRTLVVTSNPDVAAQMDGVLKQATGSFNVTRSESAKDAASLCKSSPPDCILYDNNASGDDGAAFVLMLEEQCGHIPAPVIALLPDEKNKVLAKLIKAGVTDYLLLPDLQPDTVSRTLRYALERRVLEKRLSEQRNLFKAVLGGSPGFIAIKNDALQYQAINPAFCAFLGKGQEEVVGKTDEALFGKKDADLYNKDDSHVLKSGIPHTKQIEMTGVEGPRWLEVLRTPIIDAKGEIAGVFFAGHDVTAAIELERQVQDLKGAIDNVSLDQTEMVCRVAAKGVLTHVNRAVCHAFGKTPDELVGQGFSTLIPKDAQTEVRNLLASLKPENPAGTHRQKVEIGGDQRWQQWTTRAMYNESGKLDEFVAVGHDITALVRAEEAASTVRSELEASVAAFDELTKERQAADDAAAAKQAALEEKERALAQAQTEHEQLRNESEDARKALAEAQQQLEQKNQELQQIQERAGALEAQQHEFQEKAGKLEQAVKEKDDALAHLQQEIEGRDATIREREGAVADLERRLQESDQLLKAGEAALAESEAEVTTAKEHADMATRERAALEQRLDDILALIPTGVFELAAGTKVTFMSRGACEILGCGPDEAETGNLVLLDFFDPKDKKAATECMKDSMQHRVRTSGEYRVLRRDESTVDVILTAVPIVRDDKIHGMFAALTDVSAGKQAGMMLESIRRLADTAATTAGMLTGVARLTSGLVQNGEATLDTSKLDALEKAAEDARQVLEQLLAQKAAK